MALKDFFDGAENGINTYYKVNKAAKELAAADLINNGLEQEYANKMALNNQALRSQASAYDLATLNNQNAIDKQKLAKEIFDNSRQLQLNTGLNNVGNDYTGSLTEQINQGARYTAADQNRDLINKTYADTIKAGALQGQQTLDSYQVHDQSINLAKESLNNPNAWQDWLNSGDPIKMRTATEWMQKTQQQKDKTMNAALLNAEYGVQKDKSFTDGFAAFNQRFVNINSDRDVLYDTQTGKIIPRNQAIAAVFGAATGDYFKLMSSPNATEVMTLTGGTQVDIPRAMLRFGFRKGTDGNFYDANGHLVTQETFNRALAQIRKESGLSIQYDYKPVDPAGNAAQAVINHTYGFFK
ncbi:hypothetical protein HPC38_01370 [Pasteurellaceae bacterium HPA106]|uniref:hypothetical protein n=1 Tax=Spirabiliibacterium pneumoniae TaxID=221400 RepID=UPI001AAD54B1|nr:hypothetical protein [Spirabiliibacterium pneumoniae]MBE2895527.1 hypothetical protein [Spirabiliibacterium pneumoniae]